MTKRLLASTAVCCLALLLGSCSPFSAFVSDRWPHWAGGMPEDVPPRPGAPGYEEFIAHKPDGSGAPAPTPVAQKVAAPAQPPASAAPRENPPPADAPPADSNAGQGGLY